MPPELARFSSRRWRSRPVVTSSNPWLAPPISTSTSTGRSRSGNGPTPCTGRRGTNWAPSGWPGRSATCTPPCWATGPYRRGWTARAQTLLSESAESPEAGWVSLNLGMFEDDRAKKDDYFRAALDAARRTGDADLEFAAVAHLGASLVHGDRFDRWAEADAALTEAVCLWGLGERSGCGWGPSCASPPSG